MEPILKRIKLETWNPFYIVTPPSKQWRLCRTKAATKDMEREKEINLKDIYGIR